MQTDIKSFYCIVLWVPIEPLAVMSKMCVMTGVVMTPGELLGNKDILSVVSRAGVLAPGERESGQ